jgi:nitrilase
MEKGTMPESSQTPFKIAAVQATPVFLDGPATLDKACSLIAEAGREGAQLALFPESFIPGYPDWVWTVPSGEGAVLNPLYADFLANSVTIPGESTEQLCEAARQAGIAVVMGLSERNAEASGGSLYNTVLYIDAEGQILGKHRKLVPTGGERLVWAQGDGGTLGVYDLPFARVGGLICWENYMPLARYAMYAWGTQLYLAPTWDHGEIWLSTLRHIAKEGRVFVVGCCMALRKDDIPDRYGLKERFYANAAEWINPGDSVIVSPSGEFIAGPVQKKEAILYAEIEPQRLLGAKWMLDVAGHYARPDVFQLTIHREPRPMIKVQEDEPRPGPDL